MYILALLYLLLERCIINPTLAQPHTRDQTSESSHPVPLLASGTYKRQSHVLVNSLFARANTALAGTATPTGFTLPTVTPQASFGLSTTLDQQGIIFATERLTMSDVNTHFIVFLKGVSPSSHESTPGPLLAGIRAFDALQMLRGMSSCSGDWVIHVAALFPKFARTRPETFSRLRLIWQEWYPRAESISFFSYDAFERAVPVTFNFRWDVNSSIIDAEEMLYE